MELSEILPSPTVRKHQFFSSPPSLLSSSHNHTWLMETEDLTIWTFVGKVTSLLFNTLSRFVIAFLSRSNSHLNSKLMAAVTICPEPVSCSIQVSNCCFLTNMWVPQETGKIAWYSHLFKSFAVLWSMQQRL